MSRTEFAPPTEATPAAPPEVADPSLSQVQTVTEQQFQGPEAVQPTEDSHVYRLTGDAGRISLDGLFNNPTVQRMDQAIRRGTGRALGAPAGAYGSFLGWREQRAERLLDKLEHKEYFYSALGALTMARIEGRPESSVAREQPQSWIERLAERRVDHRLDKFVRAKIRRDGQGLAPVQTHGYRPWVHQRERGRVVSGQFRRGEITREQAKIDKQRVKATRNWGQRADGSRPIAVRSQRQRATGRKLTRETTYAQAQSEQVFAPHWRNLRRIQAERTLDIAQRRRVAQAGTPRVF